MNNKLVSILIPVYNVEKFLPDCFSSLENQTYDNIEAIFVNDGSTDNSKELIEDFCKKHSWAKLINQENQGPSSARNAGIANSSGEFVYFYDPDDVIHPQVIDTYVKYCEFDIVTSGYSTVENETKFRLKKFKSINKINHFVLEDKEKIYVEFLKKLNSYFCRTVWNKLFKRSILKKIDSYPNIFDKNIQVGEDTNFICKYLLLCNNSISLKKKLYYYRKRKQSILHSGFNRKYLGLLKCLQPLENLDEKRYPMTVANINAFYAIHSWILLCKLTTSKDKQAKFELNDYLTEKFNYYKKKVYKNKFIWKRAQIAITSPLFKIFSLKNKKENKKSKKR